MKWVALKGEKVLCTIYAPDRAQAERYLPPMFHGAVVMSSASYEIHRQTAAIIQRDHIPPKLWQKSR